MAVCFVARADACVLSYKDRQIISLPSVQKGKLGKLSLSLQKPGSNPGLCWCVFMPMHIAPHVLCQEPMFGLAVVEIY